ncbi:MAG: hypothetical protein HXX19_00640 [Rhodoferax sp.]|nr:hypothetical protein [Rhodoferax sp.]
MPTAEHPPGPPAFPPRDHQAGDAPNPFDEVEFLPGLGVAVLWVVLSYVFVNLLLMPVHPI